MGLTSAGLWYDGPQGSGIRTRFLRRCAAGRRRFLKTREKPAGEVRPLRRARNQVREPRRRRHAPAPAQVTRGKGTRSPSEGGETMTATDPPTGGDAVRRRMTAPLPGTAAPAARGPRLRGRATIYPPASSRTARSADPGPQAAWPRPREAPVRRRRAVQGDGQGPCGCAGPQAEGKSHERIVMP